MALKVTHKDVGNDLTRTEWEAEDSHVIAGAYTDSAAVAAAKADADIADAISKKHSNEHVIVRKTSDQTVNNSTDYVDDSELKMAVGANEIWLVEIFLKVQTTAIADLKCQLTCPVGGTVNARSGFPTYALGNFVGASTQITHNTAADLTNAAGLIMVIYVGGANAGTLQLQWAQNAADAHDTKMLTNSLIIAHRIA
jgi:hypothetical protein